MYYLLTERFKDQEQILVDIISKNGSVLKIYFLASTLAKHRTESIFMQDAPGCHSVGHYYLLIIIENDQKGTNYFQDKIENSCSSFMPVTAVVKTQQEFTSLFFEDSFFVREVLTKAVVLYESKNCDLPKSASISNRFQPVHNSGNIFKNSLITGLLEGASFYIERDQNRLALFLLHQAIEHSLNSILKIKIGLQFNTHNIDKLLRYAAMADYRIGTIFPKNNESNRKIFSLVHKAYHDSRYKEEFSVSDKEIRIILERATRIVDSLVAMQH